MSTGKTAEEAASDLSRPVAPLRTDTFRQTRPEIVGGDIPESPFPIKLAGAVQRGYGRGSKDLGCPTANLPDESLQLLSSVTSTGIYFGYAQVLPRDNVSFLCTDDHKVWPMVMSLGQNPFYKNEHLTAEVHLMHEYRADFYDYDMKVLVLGYIRPELDYTSREALIDDIETDKRVALQSLARPGYMVYALDKHFQAPEGTRL